MREQDLLGLVRLKNVTPLFEKRAGCYIHRHGTNGWVLTEGHKRYSSHELKLLETTTSAPREYKKYVEGRLEITIREALEANMPDRAAHAERLLNAIT